MPEQNEASKTMPQAPEDERVLASDLMKYLRLRAEAENFRRSRPQLDAKLSRLLHEGTLGYELSVLNWDIPSL